jgi:hypothetical protein
MSLPPIFLLCHPEKEKARYERLMRHLLEVGLDPDTIHVSVPVWGTELTCKEAFKAYDPFLQRSGPTLCFKAAALTKAEISLCMNFLAAAEGAIKRGGPAIFFESDVWLRADFVTRLSHVMADLSGRAWDYVSLGEGCNTRPPGCPTSYYGPTRLSMPPHPWVFRCTDSMLLSERFLRAIITTMRPFKECLDWELNWQAGHHRAVCLWADPPLAEQGTWNSRTHTSL